MVLSELTNKELKGILRENDVRNYSKMNKKGLLKKVKQLIKAQNGGKDGKGKNGKKKKYTLKDFIGGAPPADPPTGAPGDPAAPVPPADPPAGALPAAAPAANGPVAGDPVSANGAPVSANGAPAASASQGATAPNTPPDGAKKNNAKKGNDPALYVYSANPNNENSIGKAKGITPTKKYGNINKPNNSSTNNKNTTDECGSCSMQ